MALTLTEPNVYYPVWTENGYCDECPIQPRVRMHTPFVCNCRHKADTFRTNTEFAAHVKHKYHQDYVKGFQDAVSKDMTLLNGENTRLKLDVAILYGKHAALEARLKRETGRFTEKINELEEEARQWKLQLEAEKEKYQLHLVTMLQDICTEIIEKLKPEADI